jgi:large subunit ribosomal protein L5
MADEQKKDGQKAEGQKHDGQKHEGQKKDDQQKKAKAGKGEPKAAKAAEEKSAEAPRHAAKERPRLRVRFEKEVAFALLKELELKNPMSVPRLNKIVVNMGVGEATQNAKIIDPAVNELGQITGQKPVVTKAKKSIAAFKVREGMPIGAMVTLRGDRMYEFFDRLVTIVLPRVRDFRGVSTKSFDGRGNYTLGLHDQLIFPEIDYAKVDKLKGMNVTIVTTARNDNQARSLLKHLGMPFRA